MVVYLIFICCSINAVEGDRETLKQSDVSAAAADAVDDDGDDDENDETNQNASSLSSVFHSTGRRSPATQHMYVS